MEFYSNEEDEERSNGYLEKLQALIFSKKTIQCCEKVADFNSYEKNLKQFKESKKDNLNKENIFNLSESNKSTAEASPIIPYISKLPSLNTLSFQLHKFVSVNVKSSILNSQKNFPKLDLLERKINVDIKNSYKKYYKGLSIIKEETNNQRNQFLERLKKFKEGKVNLQLILLFKKFMFQRRKTYGIELKSLAKSNSINEGIFTRTSLLENLISPKKKKQFTLIKEISNFNKKKALSNVIQLYIQDIVINQRKFIEKLYTIIFNRLQENFNNKVNTFNKFQNHIKQLELIQETTGKHIIYFLLKF